MKIYELFSKRQKRLQGEVPDVYRYDDISQELRVQIVHIWRAVLRDSRYSGDAHQVYKSLHQKLSYEYGKFTLDQDGDSSYHSVRNDSYHVTTVINFFLGTDDIERAIDVIELSFQCIDQDVRYNRNRSFSPRISPDEAINELNYRFREHGVGYQYESGRIIKIDSQFIHSEAIKPALIMLSNPMYKGANEEFLKAHVAIAATHNIPYLVTWNFTHPANAYTRPRIEQVCREAGCSPPRVDSPKAIMEER